MSDDDFYDDEPMDDEGTGIANGMVILTGLILLGAIWLMLTIAKEQYGVGWLA
jgi:hypothetical protein